MTARGLFPRETRASDTAAEIKRAHAHRLLDGVRAGLAQCSDAEVWQALWITGDARPVARNYKGLADLDKRRQQAAMT